MTSITSLLANGLKSHGITLAAGVVGGGASLDLVRAMNDLGIAYLPVHHEASAAIIAGALGREGKCRGAAISIKGPGFANLLPGILSNYFEGRPSVTISESYLPDAPPSVRHKRMDQFHSTEQLVKGYWAANENRDGLSRLLQISEKEAPGPIHIDLNLQNRKNSDPKISNQACYQLNASLDDLKETLIAIENSRCPVVVMGSYVNRSRFKMDWSKLTIPVVTTASAKGIFDEYSPFAAGIITGEIGDLSPEKNILSKADLIVAIGLRTVEMVKVQKFDVPSIFIDECDPMLISGYQPQVTFLSSNLEEAMHRVFEVLSKKSWGRELVSGYRARLESHFLGFGWNPANAFSELHSALSGDCIVVLDTGLFCTIGETVWRSRNAEDFCGSSCGRFMGLAIPTAVGVSVSSRQRTVLAVLGDGGIGPYFAEIQTAIDHKLPIIFALMSDGRYGSIALASVGKTQSSQAYEFKNRRWHELAAVLGCQTEVVTAPGLLQRAISNWDRSQGPLFLELPFEPNSYLEAARPLRY
ncbi:MAG: thiamine pyrophosphate-binding protein [Oligoflexia bacterium]|nr:thiamine pyrophosphate-binding protein [Oligoflexia bacterium]